MALFYSRLISHLKLNHWPPPRGRWPQYLVKTTIKKWTHFLIPSRTLVGHTTNKTVLDRYMRLKISNEIPTATYVWIDHTGETLRAKTKAIGTVLKDAMGQITQTEKSEVVIVTDEDDENESQSIPRIEGSISEEFEVWLKPIREYKDPFTPGNNKLILCETFGEDRQPSKTNHRRSCQQVMRKVKNVKPWFGMEQEYTLLDQDHHPLGWPKFGFPGPQGPYACGVGTINACGRDIVESHYRACLYAGVNVTGTNAEVMPSQWEYQVGPCEGIQIADDLWMSRFVLHRVAEDFGVRVSFDPKPVPGDWNGAGCHTNFSTLEMREDGGYMAIEKAVEKLAQNHAQHMKVYDAKGGQDNLRRLNGRHQTSNIHQFSAAVGDRDASVRIPIFCAEDKKGFIEDRRPASNCDPYRVIEVIIRTVCL